MEIVKLKLSALEPNTGQVPGLPMNPRQWTASDVEKIAASLTETPELFEARPLLVYPHEGKFVILGGNLRHEGAKRNKATEAPCIVFPEDTPLEKLKEIVVKDNGSFGAWDYDALANEWGDLPLTDWGVPAWDSEPLDLSGMEVDQTAAPGKSDTGFSQISFLFTAADAIVVNGFIEENGKEALVQKIVELCLTAEAK